MEDPLWKQSTPGRGWANKVSLVDDGLLGMPMYCVTPEKTFGLVQAYTQFWHVPTVCVCALWPVPKFEKYHHRLLHFLCGLFQGADVNSAFAGSTKRRHLSDVACLRVVDIR